MWLAAGLGFEVRWVHPDDIVPDLVRNLGAAGT